MTQETVTLLNGNVIPVSRIVRKTIVGKAKVFDLNIRDQHNYYANGINVHNCNYHEILDEHAKRRGEDELYKIRDTFMFYRPAALHLAPQSPSTRTLRGSTRIAFTVDELGHFSENKELVNISGIEVWNALINSLQTVRPEAHRLRREGIVSIPPALAMAISSPRDVADPIMVLRKDHARSNDSYVMLRPTWEANPRLSFEHLKNEKKSDMVSFWRDFGCKPPLSESPFIANESLLFDIIDKHRKPAFRQKTTVIRDKRGERKAIGIRLQYIWTDSDTPKILAFDAGRTLNAFSAALAHLGKDGELVYDGFVEIRPRTNLPVDYEEVYTKVLKPIIERYGVVAIASDRWQNYSFIDRAYHDFPRIRTASCQLKYGDFIEWREALSQQELSIPRPELSKDDILDVEQTEEEYLDDRPTARFIRESVRVEDDPGKTVNKPTSGNDDVFRAAVVAHAASQMPEIARVLRESSLRKSSPDGSIAVAATGSTSYYPNTASPVGTMSGLPLPRNPISIVSPPKIEARRDKISIAGRHKIRANVVPQKTKKRK